MGPSIFILILALLFFMYKWKRSQKDNLGPPGPPSFPFVGHLPLLGMKPQVTLAKWKKTYGSIISIQFGSTRAVVLNDAKLIQEAFSLDVFSGRPYIQMFHQVLGGKRGLVMNDGAGWFEQRKFVAKSLNECGIRSMEVKTQEEVEQLLDHLAGQTGQPISMKHCFSAPVLNALWNIIMGTRFTPDDPELNMLVKRIETGTSDFGMLTGLAIAIQLIGNWFPGITGVTKIVDSLCEVRDVIGGHVAVHNKTRIRGQPRDFTDLYLDKVEATKDPSSSFHVKENQQPLTTSELFAAGYETTSATLEWLVVYMILYPQVQLKLQQEIDLIVGHSRRPCLNDQAQMNYTVAVINETMRFASSGPFGLFHCAMDNVNFAGYKLLKDTLIMANFHCINHDPESWGDPENFRPERFQNEQGNLIKFEHFLPFSTGRRGCIGSEMARDTLFLFCTGLFQKFVVNRAQKLPSLEAKMGFLISPQPFQVILTERS